MGCGPCAENQARREAARREMAQRGQTPETVAAMTAGAVQLFEVFWPDGSSSGRRFSNMVAAQMFVGRRSATIRPVA